MDITDYKVADHPARLYRLPGSEYAQFEHYGDYFTVACSTIKQADEVTDIARNLSAPTDVSDRQSLLLTYGSREPQTLSFTDAQKRIQKSPKDILFVRLHLSNDLVITWRSRQIDSADKTFPAQAGLVGGSFHERGIAEFLRKASTFHVSKSARKIASNMAYLYKDPD